MLKERLQEEWAKITSEELKANLDWPRYPAAPAAPLYRSTALPLSRSPAL